VPLQPFTHAASWKHSSLAAPENPMESQQSFPFFLPFNMDETDYQLKQTEIGGLKPAGT
jgi:hypothetical protein